MLVLIIRFEPCLYAGLQHLHEASFINLVEPLMRLQLLLPLRARSMWPRTGPEGPAAQTALWVTGSKRGAHTSSSTLHRTKCADGYSVKKTKWMM